MMMAQSVCKRCTIECPFKLRSQLKAGTHCPYIRPVNRMYPWAVLNLSVENQHDDVNSTCTDRPKTSQRQRTQSSSLSTKSPTKRVVALSSIQTLHTSNSNLTLHLSLHSKYINVSGSSPYARVRHMNVYYYAPPYRVTALCIDGRCLSVCLSSHA